LFLGYDDAFMRDGSMTLDHHHVCLSNDLTCSGSRPCPACEERHARCALLPAIEASGMNDRQAAAFVENYRGATGRLRVEIVVEPAVVADALDIDVVRAAIEGEVGRRRDEAEESERRRIAEEAARVAALRPQAPQVQQHAASNLLGLEPVLTLLTN